MPAELYKSASAAREVAERRERERRRALVVLCARFLASHGYDEACERLSAASGVSLSKVRTTCAWGALVCLRCA